MIIYFSATGNSKYIAQRIAAVTGDDIVSVTDCVQANQYQLCLGHDEDLGFVTPTYFWGLPSIVMDFLDRLRLETKGNHYVYHILTCGTSNGMAQHMMAKALRSRGIRLQGSFAVRMVDTWTPIFDLTDQERNQRVTAAAEPQIDAVIRLICNKAVGDFNRSKGLAALAPLVYAGYQRLRKTKRFCVLDACAGCGLCAKNCPSKAIELQSGKPVWIRDKCTLCLGCLHRCPEFAIQYGRNTEKHGQYVHPSVKL